jgi:S-adenosylmethionine decarboxylase
MRIPIYIFFLVAFIMASVIAMPIDKMLRMGEATAMPDANTTNEQTFEDETHRQAKENKGFRLIQRLSAPILKTLSAPVVDSLAPVEHSFFGRHMIASYVNCDMDAMRDLKALEAAMRRAVAASGATLLQTVRHVFPPDGLTVAMLLSESHASIHTYPEFGACFVDLFTCGTRCKAEAFDSVMREYLKPEQSDLKVLLRHSRSEEDRWVVHSRPETPPFNIMNLPVDSSERNESAMMYHI